MGQQKRMGLGNHFQQEVDLTSLYKDVASEYVHLCMVPSQAGHLIDRAIRIAKPMALSPLASNELLPNACAPHTRVLC